MGAYDLSRVVPAQHFELDGVKGGLQEMDGQAMDSNAQQFIYSQMIHLRDGASGAREIASTPYRAGTAAGVPGDLGWTCSVNDQAGRTVRRLKLQGDATTARFNCEVATQMGSTTQMTTLAYGIGTRSGGGNARQVEVTEYNTSAAGQSVTRQLFDALGRLVEVKEVFGGAEQSTGQYSYDPMGNLTRVVQGSQTRNFTYRTSSRLSRAQNPETGAVDFTYYRDGSVKTKSDGVANPRISYS